MPLSPKLSPSQLETNLADIAPALKIPNGIPSLEDHINLYFTHGVIGGRIDLHRLVGTASTQTAKIFGLYPRKGTQRVFANRIDLVCVVSVIRDSFTVGLTTIILFPMLKRAAFMSAFSRQRIRLVVPAACLP